MSRILTIILWTALLAAAAWSAPRPEENAQQLLVLKNGHILTGRITHSGDHYFVDRAGSQIGVRAMEVECLALNLDDAYRQQRGKIPDDDLDARQRLVEWCIRHELLEHAAVDLALCRELQPRNARTAELIRRLETACQARPAGKQQGSVTPPEKTSDEPTTKSGIPGKPADILDKLPSDAVETFATSIQPMLINQCAAGGCHGLGSKSKFTLTRFNPRKTSSRAYTRRNLEAVLAQIDRGTPSASSLLTTPREPHGGAKLPVFHGRNLVQYEQLLRWVGRVTGQEAASTPHAKSQASHAAKSAEAGAAPIKRRGAPPAANSESESTREEAAPAVSADEFNQRFFPNGRPNDPK